MATNVEKSSNIDIWRKRLGIPLTFIIFTVILVIATPTGLTVAGQNALAMLAGLVVLYLTEPVELTVVSLMVIPTAVFLGLGNVKSVLESFATSPIFLLVGAIMMAAAMEKLVWQKGLLIGCFQQ
ncbi:di/tricarboxylate transporter [Sporomusaceae bacterium BoRhaA]|nr:anion permease [Pelorhabdus rhamnosifermentans]MBU2703963.1 di/tricarboxylate transporter [Pelorhabdus rhamnosifermentans]